MKEGLILQDEFSSVRRLFFLVLYKIVKDFTTLNINAGKK